jgi:hypothetical protein
MKANSYIKSINILDRIQLYFDSLDLTKIGMRGSIFAHMSRLPIVTELKPDDAKLNLSNRGNTGNHQVQKHKLARRHRSINWRWQSRLMQWL